MTVVASFQKRRADKSKGAWGQGVCACMREFTVSSDKEVSDISTSSFPPHFLFLVPSMFDSLPLNSGIEKKKRKKKAAAI